MAGFFPRLALFILWVARLTRIDAAFDTFLLPLLGITCPCPHGQGHRRIRTSVRLASALPDVRQSESPSSAEQDGPE